MSGTSQHLKIFMWAGLLIGCALLVAVPTRAQAASQQTAQETAQRLKATLERLNALDEWFNEAEQRRNSWLVELQRQDHAIAGINNEVASIRTQLRDTNREIADMNRERESLEVQRADQARLIAEHVAAAYRLTGQDFLKQLLNQESPDEFERMIRYHRYFSESRLEIMAEYQATLVDLAAMDEALSQQKSAQKAQQQTLQGEQQSLSSERSTRADLISQLDAEKESKSAEYDRLEADRGRLQSLLSELRRRATALDGTAFAKAKGTLPMPTQGRVRHAFGARRASGRLRWHGLDIAAAQGTDVTAVFRGRVIFADWLRGFGLLTILDHGSDYMTLYGHTDALYKKVGDWVEPGEVIASAGNSGGKTEPGLYFEVRHKGQPKDPIGWVKR